MFKEDYKLIYLKRCSLTSEFRIMLILLDPWIMNCFTLKYVKKKKNIWRDDKGASCLVTTDMLILLRLSGFSKPKIGFLLWVSFYIWVKESLCPNRDYLCPSFGLLLAQQTLIAADFNWWGYVRGTIDSGTLVMLFLITNLNFQNESLLLDWKTPFLTTLDSEIWPKEKWTLLYFNGN